MDSEVTVIDLRASPFSLFNPVLCCDTYTARGGQTDISHMDGRLTDGILRRVSRMTSHLASKGRRATSNKVRWNMQGQGGFEMSWDISGLGFSILKTLFW